MLSEPEWAGRMTDEDRRALTPLFWSHEALYGRWILKMNERLDHTRGPAPGPQGVRLLGQCGAGPAGRPGR
nr:hypothetical protein Ade03nite_59280 [Actinoplanes derwentensis]